MYKVNTNKLKSIRIAKGFSQIAIAELLFMEQTTYSKIENGKNSLKIDTAFKIVEVLQISLEDFIEPPISKPAK